jgi:hypothetical protein
VAVKVVVPPVPQNCSVDGVTVIAGGAVYVIACVTAAVQPTASVPVIVKVVFADPKKITEEPVAVFNAEEGAQA